MGVMKDRHGNVVAVRYATKHTHEGNVTTGVEYHGNLTVRVTDDGPDKGRLVHVYMEPEEMMTWAQKMLDVAGETQKMRDNL